MPFLGLTGHFSAKNGALRWRILVGKLISIMYKSLAVVILRVKVSCITSVDGIALWFSSQGECLEVVQSKQAFLFSLVNPFGIGPVRIPAEENESGCSIVCDSKYGPTFGRNLVTTTGKYLSYLHISDNANSSRSSYCSLSGKFSCPERKTGDLFFTGAEKFNVDDYEVFEFY